MKKRLFAIFSAFALVLSGCSFDDVLTAVGIKKKDEETSEKQKPSNDQKPTDTTPCSHVDANHDGVCDSCGHTGMTVTHTDTNHDGVCDTCHQGGIDVVHVDDDHDGYCDTCDTFFQDPEGVVFVTNAYEHWYVDGRGVEHRESHDFHLVSHKDKTCSDTATDEYECHKCEFRKLVKGSEFAEHHYHSVVTKEANCHEPGEITFTCSECNDSYTTEIPINKNAHNYVELSESAGVKTVKCSICDDEKSFIDHSSSQSAEITNLELQGAKEVQLQEASIAFDQTTLDNDISENVTIGAEKKVVEDVVDELNLDSSVQEKLDGQPIIDLSMVDNDTSENISTFSGKVKVTIPYQKKQNEDPNEIAIWYLSDGEPETIKAEYAEGSVSFETTHFSYYAVVHLDVEEICEQFGHYEVETAVVPSTCHALGYHDHVCLRCHKTDRVYETQYAPHDYQFVEMVNPTTSTEGYIRKECTMCHDYQDTVLPKVDPDAEASGFYETLYKSILTPDFKVVQSVVEDGDYFYEEFYVGEDGDGKFFRYSPTRSSDFVYQGKYYYSYSMSNYEATNPFAAFGIVQVVLQEIPQIYKDKAEELIGWVVDNYFIKTEIPEGYEIRLNTQAVYDTYVALRDNTLEDAIKLIISEETYNKIFEFIEDNYDKSLSDFLDMLDEKGYSLEALYDSIKRIVSYVVSEDAAAQMPTFENLIPNELMEMSVSQVVNLLLNYVDLSSLFGVHTGTAVPKEDSMQEPQIYPLHRDPEPGEGEGESQEPEIQQIVPESYADLMDLLDPFLSANLFDLIVSMQGVEEEDFAAAKEALMDMVEQVAEEIRDNAHVIINTTSTGSFISLSCGIDELHNPLNPEQAVYDANVYVTKSFDKGGILKKLAEKAADIQHFYEAISITSDNYEWFIKPVEDALSSDYPGIKFDYVYDPNDTDSRTKVKFVSTKSYTKTVDGQKITGKVVLPLNSFDGKVEGIDELGQPYTYWHHAGSVVSNTYGRGTKLPQGHVGYITQTSYYVSYGQLVPTSIDQSPYGFSVPSTGILYDFDEGTFKYSEKYGNFWYLNYDSPEVESVQHVNYEDLTESEKDYYGMKFDEDQYNFFRIKYTDGYRSLRVVDKGDYDQTIIRMPVFHESMNDQALEFFDQAWYCWDYVDGKVVKHLEGCYEQTLAFDVGNRFNDYYSIDNEEDNYSREYNYGNVRITYNANRVNGQPLCVRNISWKVYVNSSLVYSTSYRAHFDYYMFCDSENSTVKEGCTRIETTTYTCNYCGKVVKTNVVEIEDHNYGALDTIVIHEGSLTQPKITFNSETCQDCGHLNEYYNYEAPCDHDWGIRWDSVKEVYVCNHCGFEMPTYGQPTFEFEKISETEDTITFSFFTPNFESRWRYDDSDYWASFSDYSYELCLGYLDENKNIQIINDVNNPNVTSSVDRITVYEMYGIQCYFSSDTLMRTVTFDKQAFNNLLAANEGSEETLYMALCVTQNIGGAPSGDIFYFLVEM